jgi:hypothetical protein
MELCFDKMNTDISKRLQEKVLEALTPEQKIDLNDRESRELLLINPGYAIARLKKQFGETHDR